MHGVIDVVAFHVRVRSVTLLHVHHLMDLIFFSYHYDHRSVERYMRELACIPEVQSERILEYAREDMIVVRVA